MIEIKANFRQVLLRIAASGLLIATVLIIQYFAVRMLFQPGYFEITDGDSAVLLELVTVFSTATAFAIVSMLGVIQSSRRTVKLVLSLLAVPMIFVSLFCITGLYWGIEYDLANNGDKVFAIVFASGVVCAALISWILRFVFRARS